MWLNIVRWALSTVASSIGGTAGAVEAEVKRLSFKETLAMLLLAHAAHVATTERGAEVQPGQTLTVMFDSAGIATIADDNGCSVVGMVISKPGLPGQPSMSVQSAIQPPAFGDT